MNKRFVLICILVLITAAIPRGIEVLSGNYLFGFDQGLFFQDVKKIVIDHRLTLIGPYTGGQGGLFQGSGWYYLLSIPFFLTNGNPYGAMILMFLLGLATVGFAIFYGSKMFGQKTGIIIGFLIAISSAIIAQSRFIWSPFPISLLSVFYLYFLYQTLLKKQKFILLATFTIGLMSHFETAIAGTLFLQFMLLSPFMLAKKLVSLRYYLLSIGSFLLTMLPLFLFNFKHNSILLNGILNLFPKTSGASAHEIFLWKILSNHFDVFRFNFLSIFQSSHILWPVILAIFLIGTIFYLKDKKKSFAQKLFVLYLATSPITLFLVFMLYLWPIWEWWILELMIFYSFLFGILSVYVLKKRILRPFIIAVYVIFSWSFINQTIGWYKNDFNDYGGTQKIKGKLDAIDYIYKDYLKSSAYKDAKGEKFGLLVFSPPVYTYPYDYLLWWYGKRKYGFIPTSDKKGTFYLLIEPDLHKPWSYNGWLETVIKTGRIIKTQELPNGFIVQKRVE